MYQDCVIEREAIRTIENENHQYSVMGSKLIIMDAGGNVAEIDRGGAGIVTVGEVAAALRDLKMKTHMDGPAHGIFVASIFGLMFWLGVGVLSLIW